MKEFNDWIAVMDIEDVPCVGRKYTWYRPNRLAKSRLDKIMVSPEWLLKWQGVHKLSWTAISRIIAPFCLRFLTRTGVQSQGLRLLVPTYIF